MAGGGRGGWKGSRGWVRSEPRSILASLPAGPGRTSRSEAHLLADINPPTASLFLSLPPSLLYFVPPPSKPPARDLLAGQRCQPPSPSSPSRPPYDLHPLVWRRKFLAGRIFSLGRPCRTSTRAAVYFRGWRPEGDMVGPLGLPFL